MAIQHFTEDGAVILMPGEHKVIAIGPGGDGAKGGKSNSSNSATGVPVIGAYGGGGAGGGYVYEGVLNVQSLGILSMVIEPTQTKLFGSQGVSFNLTLDKTGLSGSNAGGINPAVPVPANSVAPGQIYDGSRGGGAGGTYGSRSTTTAPATTPGGNGDHGNGAASVAPAITGPGDLRPGGMGAAGGVGNPISANLYAGGVGGKGADENGLIVDGATTAADVATKINGGSGGNGSAPSSRPAVTGMPGGTGGGGGGAWTSGSDGAVSGAPGAGVNGEGGVGGIGGTGCVWIIDMTRQKSR